MSTSTGKVFVSWSGEASQRVAKAFRTCLPPLINNVDVFLSSEDIGSGEEWRTAIAGNLERSKFGIICLTPSNLCSSWIHFEAGAIANKLHGGGVCCYLINNVKISDVAQPLSAYHNRTSNKDDTWSLIKDITRVFPQKDMPSEEVQRKLFDKFFWNEMSEALSEAAVIESGQEHKPRSTDSKLDEVLNVARSISAEIQRLPEGRQGLTLIGHKLENALRQFDLASAPEIQLDPPGQNYGRFYLRLSEYVENLAIDDEIWIMSNHRLRNPQAIAEPLERDRSREVYSKKLLARADTSGKYFRVMCFPELPNDGAIQEADLKSWVVRHVREMSVAEAKNPNKVSLRIARQVFNPDVMVVPNKLAVLTLDVTDGESEIPKTQGLLIFRYPTCKQVVDYLMYVVATAWRLGHRADWP